jgi:hypothetical protein
MASFMSWNFQHMEVFQIALFLQFVQRLLMRSRHAEKSVGTIRFIIRWIKLWENSVF